MDLIGSILNSMAEPPSQINIDSKKTTNKAQSFKCNICGKIFPHRNSFRKHKIDHEELPNILKREIYLHQLEYEDNVKKEKGSDLEMKTGLGESTSTDTVMKRQSRKCPVCGKLLESGKAFRAHMHKHKRNKLGKRPFSKEYAKKLKKGIPMLNLSLQRSEDETQISACTTAVEANQKANIGFEPPATSQTSVKSDNDKAQYLSNSFKCDICDKIFNRWKLYRKHKKYHVRQTKILNGEMNLNNLECSEVNVEKENSLDLAIESSRQSNSSAKKCDSSLINASNIAVKKKFFATPRCGLFTTQLPDETSDALESSSKLNIVNTSAITVEKQRDCGFDFVSFNEFRCGKYSSWSNKALFTFNGTTDVAENMELDTVESGLSENTNTDAFMNTHLRKCPLCGKLFESGRSFVRHKRKHARDKLGLNISLQNGKKATQFSAFTTPVQASLKTGIAFESSSISQVSIKPNSYVQPLNPTKKIEHTGVNELTSNLSCLKSVAAMPLQQSSYKCDICNRTFTNKKAYKNHKYNHKKYKKKDKLKVYECWNKKKAKKTEKNNKAKKTENNK